jgi:hypothetical protein
MRAAIDPSKKSQPSDATNGYVIEARPSRPLSSSLSDILIQPMLAEHSSHFYKPLLSDGGGSL